MIFWSETMSDSYRLYKMMWPFLGPDGVSAARVQKLHHHGDETAGKNEEPSEFLSKQKKQRCATLLHKLYNHRGCKGKKRSVW